MKKNIVLLLCLVLCLSSIFAYDNNQKIWRTDSEVFEAIKYLYILQGKALPSTSGPWSNAELLLMAEKIDSSSLEGGAKNAYDWLMNELDYEPTRQPADGLGIKWGFDANLEGYFHSNTDSAFVGRDNWIYGTMEQEPFIDVTWETWATKHIYGYFEFDLQNSLHVGSNNSLDVGVKKLSTNILMFQNLSFYINSLDFNFPNRAFFSVGGDNWTIQMGRDRLSWGAGETGNLVISDTMPHHNLVRFSTFFNSFKYSFLTSFFPHPLNYAGTSWGRGSQTDEITGLSFYMAHRVEGRFFNDKFGLALTEAIMYMSEDGVVDPRILNPMAFFHNYYIRSNANSTMTLELDYTPINGLNIYGQVMVDEFSLPGEPTAKNSSWAFPQAFGFLGGVKASYALGDGIFHASLEGVKTDPFLYLRYFHEENKKQSLGDYGLNYVVAFRSFNTDEGIVYDEQFLGYKYGGDAIVLNANAGWTIFDKFSVEGNFFYMKHGTFDKWTCWTTIGDGSDAAVPLWEHFVTPTSEHDTSNNKNNAEAQTRDAVSVTTVIGGNVSYQISEPLKAFVQGDFISVKNYGNHSGVDKKDIQLTFGISYSI